MKITPKSNAELVALNIVGNAIVDEVTEPGESLAMSYCQKLWTGDSGGGFLGFDSVDKWSSLNHIG